MNNNNLELEKNLNYKNDDLQSIITQDKLRKFNEIYGFENGPAIT